jgi:hypothetical protein
MHGIVVQYLVPSAAGKRELGYNNGGPATACSALLGFLIWLIAL